MGGIPDSYRNLVHEVVEFVVGKSNRMGSDAFINYIVGAKLSSDIENQRETEMEKLYINVLRFTTEFKSLIFHVRGNREIWNCEKAYANLTEKSKRYWFRNVDYNQLVPEHDESSADGLNRAAEHSLTDADFYGGISIFEMCVGLTEDIERNFFGVDGEGKNIRQKYPWFYS